MRKRRLGIIPLSFLALVLLHIGIFGMPESAAEEFGADAPTGKVGSHSDGEQCPVDMMIVFVRDAVLSST